jgi:Tfp pilus assembly protein PilO
MSLHSIRNIQLPSWLKENKKLRTAAMVCAGLVCVNMLLYAVLVAPAAARLTSWEIKYAELRKRRTDAILFQKQKQAVTGLKAGIPAQKDMPLLVKEFVQAARRLNLTVAAVTYDIPKGGGEAIAMLSFSFPVEGRYPDVKRFIYEVEISDRLVGIQDVEMDADKGRVKLQMKLVTYIKSR